jgi:hypothetical protein
MPAAPRGANVPRLFRYAGALLVLGGGAIHLSLYLDGYSSIPRIGTVFLVNVAAAVLIAAALAFRPIGSFALAALLFSVGTMTAFVLSRTTGILGFREVGWDVRSAAAFATEALSVAVIGVWFSSTRPTRRARALIGRRRAESSLPGPSAA